MANSLLKLTVESSEYDAKLKKAAEGVRHLADVAHKSAGDMTGLEQSTLDYIKSIGEMETKSRSAAGQVRELESTYKELKVIYDQLNDVEKADEGGKALAASLEQLKQRAQDARSQLDNASKSLQENASAGKESSGMLDALSQKFTLNIDALKLFDMGLTAAKAALDVAKDAFFASESNIDDWGRSIKASEGAYDEFLQTLNNGNWQNFFDNLSSAIQGARDLYDALDRLGSIKSNNQAAIAIVQQQVQQLRLMKQQGQKVDDQLKAATDRLALLQKQSVDAGKTAGSKMIGETIRNGYQSYVGAGKLSGSSVNTAVNDIIKNGQKAFDKYAKIAEDLEKKGTSTRHSNYGGSEVTYKTFDINNLTKEEQKQYRLAKTITERETEIQKGITLYAQAVNEGAAAAREQLKGNKYAMAGSGKGGNKKDTKEQTELQQNQKKINDLTQQYVELSKKGLTTDDERLVKLRDEIKELEKRNGLLSLYSERAQGRLLPQTIDMNAKGVNRTMFGDLGLTQKPKGLDKPAQLDEKALKAVQKNIQKQTDLQVKELKESKKEDKSLSTGIGNLAGGMSSVVGGLEQLGIEIPDGFKSALSAMQGISSILTGIAATVLAIEAIAGADAVIPFANGGIVHAAGGWNGFVPGNNFSGDTVPALLNSGELVLNRAQQGVLASELSGGGMQNIRLEAVVSGEQILLSSNNRGRRTGRGEIVQSKRVR